jgi:tRNA nucleotidyltransferase (CCA-adding enzyme)
MAVNVLVSENINPDAFKVLDCGVKRTLADLTHINQRSAEVCRYLNTIITTHSRTTTADQCIEIYNCGVGKVHERLIEYCGKQVRIYSSATVRTAAVCLILDGVDENYVKNVYANLCHQKFNELPTIAHAFIKQVNDHKFSTNHKSQLIARALKVMNPEYADVTRLQITESEQQAALEYCRSVVKPLLIKGQ